MPRPPRRTVQEAIEQWAPAALGADGVAFAREVVRRCGPANAERAKDLLQAAAKLAAFGTQVGLVLTPEVLLHPSVVERLVVSSPGLSGPTLRTLRTNLRHIALRARPGGGPRPVPLGRERAKAPYTPAEIDGFLRRCDAQPTEARRQRAQALVCLGAGAGLTGCDLRHLRGHHVVVRSGGVLVAVTGRRPRLVPLLARHHERVLASAAFAGGGYLVGGTDAARRNVTNRLNAAICGGDGLPRLSVARLRVTWLAEVAAGLGLRAFMDAAGITCSQRLGDVVATLAPADEAGAVRLLGAAR